MSKKLSPRFKYESSGTAPHLPEIRTTWDLATLFYSSHTDPQIEIDLQETERAYAAFVRRYAKKNFTQSATTLANTLTAYCKLAHTRGGRVMAYFAYRHVLDADDHIAEQKQNLISERLTKLENSVLFVHLTIGRLPRKVQQSYLVDPVLAPFRYLLRQIFEDAKHTRTEAEEKILNLKQLPARSLWIAGTNKIINRQQVTYKGTAIPLQEAIERTSTVKNSERPHLWQLIIEQLRAVAPVAEHELNAIVLDKKINDELRGYKKPYESKVLANENNLASVEALVAAISDRGFALSRDFYKAKAALHGVPALQYASRYDSIGSDPKISFSDAVEICRDVFYKTKHEYGAFFDDMLSRGQIDVYPKPHRSGGAFMSSDVEQPTMVFLNHVDTFKSLETLAHEMGHAIHSSRSKIGQPSYYEHYSTTTAETASTFFENLVYDAVYEQVDSETRLLLLHERIMRDIATIQRQIAFFNFECALHTTIRTEGAMTAERIASTLATHLRAHLGPAISVADSDGYSFVYIGHFRTMFYVYTYAYGLLMSNLMRTMLRNDPKYIVKVDAFLQSGGSNTVERIFNSIGIKAHKHETFLASLEAHAADIKEFSRLVKRQLAHKK